MFFKNIESVKSPIIYIALSFVISSISFGLFEDYRWLAVSSASLFFIFICFYTNITFTIVVGIFFIFGIIINSSFYTVNFNENFVGKIRIVEVRSYYKIGEHDGKRFYVEGDIKGELGDKLKVEGIFTEEIDKEKGIVGTLDVKKYKAVEKDILGKIYHLRKNIYEKLEENLGQRKAGLVASLAFGYSDYLDGQDKEEMKNLGVIHAISVSGLHVALIFSLLKILVKGKVAIVITIGYVILTGAAFSSIRALIMIVCSSSAIGVRKKYNPLGGLSVSLIIILIIKPYSIFQVGFMLSYLATLGIVLLNEKLNKKLYKLPKYIRETLAISLSAQVFTLPLMIVAFKEFSLYFLIGNLILLPILNLLVLIGNLLLVVSLITPLFDFISFILLKIIDLLDILMEGLYNFSNSSFIVNEGMTIVYIFLIMGLYFVYKGYKKFVLLPIIAMIFVGIYIYSPILRINYLREGGLLISYRGERTIITNRRNIDIGKLKEENLAQSSFIQGDNIKVLDNVRLKRESSNFIMYIDDKEYLLRLNNRSKVDEKYDIINFVEGKIEGLFIFNDELLLY